MTAELRLFNSWTREVEPFEPLKAGCASMYACGPTVYDYAHIGNFRFNVWVDILHRTLDWCGYDVTLVMNITDVDDKIIAGAHKKGLSLEEYTGPFADAFFADLETLGIRPATRYPRATEHIDEMVRLVESLMARDLAYEQDGSVYFRVGAFPDYGRLSRLEPAELRTAERLQADEYAKEDPRDFALWKGAAEGEAAWDTALGRGRPGWHLECSAMSMKYLGNTFDIHVGGVDLMFPHHENEIAQSVGATGDEFARCWLHCAHLIVDGTKMSKSLGNQHTLRSLLEAGHDPAAIRYLLASVHYRKQLNFTFEALAQAHAAVTRLRDVVQRLEGEGGHLAAGEPGAASKALETARHGFAGAIVDDLNTSGALGHMFVLVKAANLALDRGEMTRAESAALLEWFRDIDRIWALLPGDVEMLERTVEIDGSSYVASGPLIADEDVDLVLARMRARAARDFAASDALRDQLSERGIEVEDSAAGVRWRRSGR